MRVAILNRLLSLCLAVMGPLSFIAAVAIPHAKAQEEIPDVSIKSRLAAGLDMTRRRSVAIRSEVKLVQIPITVTDLFERPLLGLHKDNFRVFDDGVEQNIFQFFSEEAPVSVGMVFDASNSMQKKINQSRLAVEEFLRLSAPGDEFFLLKFSSRPAPVCPFTTDVNEIRDGLATIQSGGWTSLYDAMYLGINHMKLAVHSRKALFVLSDGEDNNSRYTEGEIRSLIREADVRVFAISILDRSASLERICEESGGRAYRIRKLDELSDMAATLSKEIHSYYVLAFSAEKARDDGKYHRVTVRFNPPAGAPPLRVAWRHGYYAPSY